MLKTSTKYDSIKSNLIETNEDDSQVDGNKYMKILLTNDILVNLQHSDITSHHSSLS
jgi:hypothetical protein